MTGWYVTTNDIRNWTDTNKRRAEEILPLLVKKLILASCNPKRIEFPSGDDIAIGGWDGILEVEKGNRFIPSGLSGWEFGTNKEVKTKADDDYKKRVNNPDILDLEQTTFVFVTSRLWTKRDKWANEKKLDEKWKDVRGINAETLSNWLEECPAVHRWFSQLIGKRCSDVWDIQEAWTAFSHQTSMNLTADFMTYKREKESNDLLSLINADNSYTIKSNSKNEAYGFILATLLNHELANCRCLIIKSQQAWDYIVASDQPLILIPYGFSPNGIGLATNKGHSVLISIDDNDTRKALISLERQSRLDREEALQKLFPNEDQQKEDKARVLYHDTKGFFEPLLRHPILRPQDYQAPNWTKNIWADVLFAILFATEWCENNNNDCEIMEQLSGVNYSDFQKEVIRLSKENDPPIRKIGEVWQVIAKMDFWLLIASHIAEPYLDKLEKVVPVIFADEDPAYDLPSEERFMASVLKAVPKYSSHLKQGIADSLALLSVFGNEFCELWNQKPSFRVKNWIRQVFDNNQNIKFWFSTQRSLTLLAEAAPDEFLNAVEFALEGDEPILLGLFKEEGDAFYGGCYHSYLLWALELISWDKKYLARVSQCLARLSEIDLGGKFVNRPFGSLREIYLGWYNNTSATHDERISILTHCLIPNYPDIAWRLMIALLINKHDISHKIHHPKYRDLHKDVKQNILIPDYHDYVDKIAILLLEQGQKNKKVRIFELIDEFDSYTEEQSQIIIDIMLSIEPQELSDEQRRNIIIKIINIIGKNRHFADTEWSYPKELLDRLEQVAHHFDFQDSNKVNLFLFNHEVPWIIDLINVDYYDYKSREVLLTNKRISVLKAIYTEKGINGIEELVIKCSLPRLVGRIAFLTSYSDTLFLKSLEWLDIDDHRGEFATGYLLNLVSNNFDKAKNIFIESKGWSSIKQAKFLLCMQYPLKMETLELVETIPEEGKKIFWTHLNYFSDREESKKTDSYIASKLLEYDRPLAAIDAISNVFFYPKEIDLNDWDSQILFNILMRIATNPTDSNGRLDHGVIYALTQAINFLQETGTIPEQDICTLEWIYLKVLKYEAFTPKYLMKSIAENPSNFVQLVSWIFRRDDHQEEPAENLSNEQIQQRAEIAYHLLESISILPGQKGNKIDKGVLLEWVKQTRKLLKEVGHLKIGDDRIGQYLSKAPKGEDDIWPHESVRDIIEEIRSQEIEQAMICGHTNARGVTSRPLFSGGDKERSLAQKYHSDAQALELIWPRSANLLRTIANSYEGYADWWDTRVELMD